MNTIGDPTDYTARKPIHSTVSTLAVEFNGSLVHVGQAANTFFVPVPRTPTKLKHVTPRWCGCYLRAITRVAQLWCHRPGWRANLWRFELSTEVLWVLLLKETADFGATMRHPVFTTHIS
jgi:hypothetical protein